jgi:hypothetical protein
MIPDPRPQLRSPASLPARLAAVVVGLALALAAGAPEPASARTDGSSGAGAGAPPTSCSGVSDLVLTAARVPAGAQRPSKVGVVPERLDQAAPGRSTGVALAAGGLLVLSVSAVAVLAERARRGDRGTGAGAGPPAKRRRRGPRRRRP